MFDKIKNLFSKTKETHQEIHDVIQPADNVVSINRNHNYLISSERLEFNPKKNITAYELSLVLSGLVITTSEEYLKEHPEIKRHFEK